MAQKHPFNRDAFEGGDTMMPKHGVVIEFDAIKGYGLIKSDDGEKIDFHVSSISVPLKRALYHYVPKGTQVDFETTDVRGYQAVNIVPRHK